MSNVEALTALLAKVDAGGFDAGAFSDAFPNGSEGTRQMSKACQAFHGSLDAAKALDLAIPTKRVMSSENAKIVLFGANGARHWLAWKLGALILEAEDD